MIDDTSMRAGACGRLRTAACLTGWLTGIAAGLAMSGCATPSPRPAAGAAARLLAAPGAIRHDALAGAPADLAAVLAHALRANPRIRMLEGRVKRAEGAIAEAGTARSPEVRIGAGRDTGGSRMTSFETESGTGTSSEWETTGTEGSGASQRDSTQTEFGWVTETGHRDETTQFGSSRAGTSQSQSHSESATATSGRDGGHENGFSLGLRIAPPNPWLIRAAVSTAQAERWLACAELRKEELALVHDLVETAVELAHVERILRTAGEWTDTCRRLRDRVTAAANSGGTPRSDAVDASLRLAAAESDQRRVGSRVASLRREFRRLSGVDPAGMPLDQLASGTHRMVPNPPDATTIDEWITTLVDQHPEVQMAAWNGTRARGEWAQARARRYPWLSQIGVAYEWWDGVETRTRWFEQNSVESTYASTAYSEMRTDTGTSYETRGPWETESATSQGYETRTGSSTSQEQQTETSRGMEGTSINGSSEEWWVEARVEIPVFEWFSREAGLRREASRDAEQAADDVRAVARREIRIALDSANESSAESATALARAMQDTRHLEQMAALSETQGLPGEMEALRIRERIAEVRMRTVEQILQSVMDDLAFCRRAGLVPAIQP